MAKKVPYDIVREDGRLEKLCEHGIGHTVGHKNPKMLDKDWVWVHGCDGCCSKFARQSFEEKNQWLTETLLFVG